MVAQAIISSRLDYCNSLLCGIAGNLLQKLQLVQNAAARLIMRTGRRQHITPVLRFSSDNNITQCAGYQFDSVLISKWLFLCTRRYTASFHSTWLKIVSSWPTLAADHCERSADVLTCATKRTCTRVGDRSFSVAGPSLWNSLPVALLDRDISHEQFKRLLKTLWFV